MITVQEEVREFLKFKGTASKTSICDHLRTVRGTLGETVGRELRHLVENGLVIKGRRMYEGKWYRTYALAPLDVIEL